MRRARERGRCVAARRRARAAARRTAPPSRPRCVRIGGSGSRSSFASRARAARRSTLVAATANIGCPANSTMSSREDRVVVLDRADVVDTRHVGGDDDVDHAGGRAHGGEIDATQPRVRDRAHADRRVQRAARLGQGRRCSAPARHVQRGRFVRQRRADGRAFAARCRSARRRARIVHASPTRASAARRASRPRVAAGLEPQPAHEVAERAPPVRGARAHVVDGRELALERARPRPRPFRGSRPPRQNALRSRGARFGVAATPPQPMRAETMRPPATTSANAANTAEMSWSKRFDSFQARSTSRSARRGTATDATNSPGSQRRLLVGEVVVLERHRADVRALAQRDGRAERDQRRHRIPDRRAVRDVAAERPGLCGSAPTRSGSTLLAAPGNRLRARRRRPRATPRRRSRCGRRHGARAQVASRRASRSSCRGRGAAW